MCDSAYAATVTPNGLPTLFSTSRVPLTLYCASGQQAHSCISNYFSRLEPTLELFVLAEPTRAFLRECADLWAIGSSPQRKGWAPMYLACLALGAMAMTEAEWAALGCAEAKAHATAAWLEEAGRLLVDAGTPCSFCMDLGSSLKQILTPAGIWHKPTVPGRSLASHRRRDRMTFLTRRRHFGPLKHRSSSVSARPPVLLDRPQRPTGRPARPRPPAANRRRGARAEPARRADGDRRGRRAGPVAQARRAASVRESSALLDMDLITG